MFNQTYFCLSPRSGICACESPSLYTEIAALRGEDLPKVRGAEHPEAVEKNGCQILEMPRISVLKLSPKRLGVTKYSKARLI